MRAHIFVIGLYLYSYGKNVGNFLEIFFFTDECLELWQGATTACVGTDIWESDNDSIC